MLETERLSSAAFAAISLTTSSGKLTVILMQQTLAHLRGRMQPATVPGMRRNPLLAALHSLLLAALLVGVVLEAGLHDGWRTFWLVVALGCFLAVRDELTERS